MLGSGSPHSIVFNTSVPIGEWVHVVITRDVASGKAYCYINGTLMDTQTLNTVSSTDLPTMVTPLVLGGDLRSGNAQYFKGSIKSVSLYSECMTAEQVAENYRGYKPTDRSSLICYYYLAFTAGDTTITDFSGNGYTINK